MERGTCGVSGDLLKQRLAVGKHQPGDHSLIVDDWLLAAGFGGKRKRLESHRDFAPFPVTYGLTLPQLPCAGLLLAFAACGRIGGFRLSAHLWVR